MADDLAAAILHPRQQCRHHGGSASVAVAGIPHSGATELDTLWRQLQDCDMFRLRLLWLPLQDMGRVPGTYIGAALVPALIITVLFYFDHSVSSQLAQVGSRAIPPVPPHSAEPPCFGQQWHVHCQYEQHVSCLFDSVQEPQGSADGA